ncbi:MAG: head decoration protein [Ignavibacteriales bacterium]|nr:head decoration protein [Ignavibacteriales bacterium]
MEELVNTQTSNSVQLLAGEFPRVFQPVTIVSGAGVLGKGTVLGKITASGKYTTYNNGAVDGSETAKLILAGDVDATNADVEAVAYASGHFNEAALTGLDAAAKVDFEGTPIFVGSVF